MLSFTSSLQFLSTGQIAGGFVAASVIGATVSRLRLRARGRDVRLTPRQAPVPDVATDALRSERPPAANVRARTGRLPLPGRVAYVTVREQHALTHVNEFVDRLAALPLPAWLETGRTIAADRERVGARGDAWAALQTAIADHNLGLVAWYVRDAVETSAFLSSRQRRAWRGDDRRMFAAAHGAAEAAALALLARPFLSANDFSTLYDSFTVS